MTLFDSFLLVGLPYVAIVTAVVVGAWRWRRRRFELTARSSQFLEDRQLLWGSGPWHMGISVVLLGHLAALLFPAPWAAAMTSRTALLAVSVIGQAAGWLALVGLAVLLARRLTNARVQAVTLTADIVVVIVLLAQVAFGLAVAYQLRHGAAWATGTAVPYVWSLLRLQPDAALVAEMPAILKLHIAGGWLLVLALPFTRLMHLLALPVGYLWRAPQRVVWSTTQRRTHAVAARVRDESRREFVKGALGLTGAAGLLAVGVSEKVFGYLRGPGEDEEARSHLLEKKLLRLRQTAEERELELERRTSRAILVASYAELSEAKGRYFIAYDMAPGLAFRGADGLPIVRSAKCTHLGCTVSSELDGQGRVLCPCHVSYFDIVSGRPNEGAPAKAPLPGLAWALIDAAGAVVASAAADGVVQGSREAARLAGCNLYITKPEGWS